MPHKNKPKQPVKDIETAAATAVVETPPQTSAGPQADAPFVPVTVAKPASSKQIAGFVGRPGEAPDPFVIALDNEAGVELSEIKRYGVMAILFQDWPTQPVVDLMEKAGYRWDDMDIVWTKPVREHSAMSTRIDAERLYQQVRQMIRQEKGIDAAQHIPI